MQYLLLSEQVCTSMPLSIVFNVIHFNISATYRYRKNLNIKKGQTEFLTFFIYHVVLNRCYFLS